MIRLKGTVESTLFNPVEHINGSKTMMEKWYWLFHYQEVYKHFVSWSQLERSSRGKCAYGKGSSFSLLKNFYITFYRNWEMQNRRDLRKIVQHDPLFCKWGPSDPKRWNGFLSMAEGATGSQGENPHYLIPGQVFVPHHSARVSFV